MTRIRICPFRNGPITATHNQVKNHPKNKLPMMLLTRPHTQLYLMGLQKIQSNKKSIVQHMALDKMTSKSTCTNKDRVL